MKFEEMRDDIPADVREALAEAIHGGQIGSGVVIEALRPKPRTVRLEVADLPAPLAEMPEAGDVWTVSHAAIGVTCLGSGSSSAKHAVEFGLAFATREDAEAWLAHLQSWRGGYLPPGTGWTEHTPGDPMPCDGEALVEVRCRNGDTGTEAACDYYWGRLAVHKLEITAWRYAREEDEE